MTLNPSKINRCDVFLLIWVLYYLQGILYPVGGIISTGLLGINLLISAVCAVKVLQMNNTPIYFRGLTWLLLMFTVYGFGFIILRPTTGILSTIPSYTYIKNIYLSLLPIYSFYYYSRKGYLTADRLRWWGMIFLMSLTLSYFNNQQTALLKTNLEEITNNVGYSFLSCIPLLVLYRKRPFLQYGFIAYCMVFIVMGMKRGAILIGAVLVLFFLYQAIKNASRTNKFILIILSCLLIVGAVWFFIYRMSTSEYMIRRIQDTLDGNSSGRDRIYTYFWNYFVYESNVLNFLFGRGANGTLELLNQYAHNDWLELAVNQGLLGVVFYFIYWKYFYKTWKHTTNIDAKVILAMVVLINFPKSMFSMSYYDMTYVSTSVLGYALANRFNPQNQL